MKPEIKYKKYEKVSSEGKCDKCDYIGEHYCAERPLPDLVSRDTKE